MADKANTQQQRIFRIEGTRSSFVKFDKRNIGVLSPVATTLLLYMLSKPDYWDFKGKNIMSDIGYTRYTFQQATKELQEKGYLIISKFKDSESGQWNTVYWVYEYPSLNQTFVKNNNFTKEKTNDSTEGKYLSKSPLIANKFKRKFPTCPCLIFYTNSVVNH